MGTDNYTCDNCNDICNWMNMKICQWCTTRQCDECDNLKYYKYDNENIVYEEYKYNEDEDEYIEQDILCEYCYDYYNVKSEEEKQNFIK